MGFSPRWRWSGHQVAQKFVGLPRPEREWNHWESNKQLFQVKAGTRDHMKWHVVCSGVQALASMETEASDHVGREWQVGNLQNDLSLCVCTSLWRLCMASEGAMSCYSHEAFRMDHLGPQIPNRAGHRKVIIRLIPVVDGPGIGPIAGQTR